MMISPATYVEELEDKSLEELIKERDKLIRSIRYFEKHKEELEKVRNLKIVQQYRR